MRNDKRINYRKDKFISKKDVINICDKLRNTQDKILVYAAYNGIVGCKLDELRNLKYSDFDSNKSVINVNGKEIQVDCFFSSLLEEAKKEKVYYINNGAVASGVKNKFEININSEYVFRCKPSLVNNQGIDPIGYPSLQSRIKAISNIVGIDITCNKLCKSKIVEDMCRIQKSWRFTEIELYLKNNKLKFKATSIQSLIKEVVNMGILEENYLSEFTKMQNRVSDFKLTVYQEKSIIALYKVVAGLSMLNEIQKRKLENEHYKLNLNNKKSEYGLRKIVNELIEVDKIYWEFIVNERFNESDQDHLIKIYANKEQYDMQNERYYISYTNGSYQIFANIEYDGPGKEKELKNDLYSSTELTDIIIKVVNDFNEVNKEKREFIINNLPYNKLNKESFTSPYLNDIGLDMIMVLNSTLTFKVAKLAFEICEKLENIDGISKAVPCIDVSTDGETHIVVIKNDSEIINLKIENLNSIKLLRSIGRNPRYISFKDFKELREFILIDYKNKSQTFVLRENRDKLLVHNDIKKNMDILIEKMDKVNETFEGIDDDFLKIKNSGYLYYYKKNKTDIIFSMYDYDLLIKYNVLEKVYEVKRYVKLKGTEEEVFNVFKSRDVDELITWLLEIKEKNYFNLEYYVY